MIRSFVIIVVLTFVLSDFHIGKVTSFFCKRLADFSSSLYLANKPVNFYVYTNANASPWKVSCYNDCEIKNLKFNSNLRTTIIIHGFMSDYKTDWIQSLIKQLFIWQDMNIIVVDWAVFFNVNYYHTCMRVPNVAVQINKFLEKIAEQSNKNLRDWPYLHIIGHSLGAHVAGQTAKILKEKIFVHRITALDPARPYFDDKGAHLKVDKAFAQFVDVIHTNSSPNERTFGLYEPLGHVDFYPNGGDKQPGCSGSGKVRKRFLRPLACLSELIFGVDAVALKGNYLWRILKGNNMICDHEASQKYFIESINDESKFTAKKVENISENTTTDCAVENCIGYSCVEMGMHSVRYNQTKYHGVYYINTKCNFSTH